MSKELVKPKDILRLEKIQENIKIRSQLIYEIRKYFYTEGIIEVETPTLIKAPAPEDYINAPQCGDFFLRTSPELHMKRLIAAGYGDIYQIGPCFRKGEYGRLHNVEFTMLEWYHTGKDYNFLLDFLTKMLRTVVQNINDGSAIVPYDNSFIDFSKEPQVFTVKEVFEKFAEITPDEAIEKNLFEILLTEKIEPALPKKRLVILKDYPKKMSALAKLRGDIAERWELYIAGIEIANTYSELIDFDEQKRRFNVANKNRARNNLSEYPEDKDFFEAMQFGLPEFTGCALGVDRLALILSNTNSIDDVKTFIEK